MSNGKDGKGISPYPLRTRAGKSNKRLCLNKLSTLSKNNKYFLDKIDGVVYSTDSFEIFSLYNRMFYEEKSKLFVPVKKPYDPVFKADKETWDKAMKQEQEKYDNGFVYKSEFVILFGRKWKKGRWVKKEVKE